MLANTLDQTKYDSWTICCWRLVYRMSSDYRADYGYMLLPPSWESLTWSIRASLLADFYSESAATSTATTAANSVYLCCRIQIFIYSTTGQKANASNVLPFSDITQDDRV